MTIIDALGDRRLLGALPAFRKLASWYRWLVFLGAVYGLPLDDAEQAVFRHHTGRSVYDPPAGGWPEVVAVVGRQSGKTRIAGTIAAFETATAPAEPDGTETYALLAAQDQRAAVRTLFSYAKAPFDRVAVLRRSVAARRAETVSLESGCVLAVYPCRPAAVRGIRARVAVVDELAYFRSSEGYPTDVEMLRAVRPCLATTAGKLIILSSPYGQSGALYDLHRAHFGRDDAPVLVWQASAPEMNPLLPADYLRRMALDDPEVYRSEVLGEFRGGVSTFLDPDAIEACVETGVRERAPRAGVSYVKSDDPASGSGKDEWATSIAHRDGERVVLDVLRAWQPPFNPSGVIAESAALGKTYGLSSTVGDWYAPGFVLEGFRANGVTYSPSERDRSAIYLELLPTVNARRVVLLDQPELLRQLRGLERRRSASGRDSVDHMAGAHDDRANAAAGAIGLASAASDHGSVAAALALSQRAPPPSFHEPSLASVSSGFDLAALERAFPTTGSRR